MQIDALAPALARHQLIIRAPLEKIWRLIVDIDNWPGWNSAVDSARLDGALRPGAIFRWTSGGTRIVSTLQDIEPMTRLVWTGKAIGTRAIHVWTFAHTHDGILVSTSESFDGWLAHLMRKTMQRALERSLAGWLKDIKKCAEAAAR